MPSNREVASLILLGGFVLLALSIRGVRQHVPGILRLLLSPKLAIPLLAYAIWIGLVVFGLSRTPAWDRSMATDTLVWFVFSGLALFGTFVREANEEGFVARALLATVGFGAFVEFYLNLVSFDLFGELVLQLVLTILVLLSMVGATKEEYGPTKRLADGLIAIIGLGWLILTGVGVANEWGALDGLQLVRDLTLPVWLTAAALPYVYALSLYSNYEQAFLRIDLATEDPEARRRAKLALLVGFHVRNRALHHFTGGWPFRLAQARTLRGARQIIAEAEASHETKDPA